MYGMGEWIEWISIEEKMPDPYEIVLIFMVSKNDYPPPAMNYVRVAFYNPDRGSGWLPWTLNLIDIYDPDGYVDMCDYSVPYWMPLPNPPADYKRTYA